MALFIQRYKAWLVGKGFLQSYDIDHNVTCSDGKVWVNLYSFLSIAGQQNMEMIQFDIKMTFLHRDLDEEIYMDQPPGFVVLGSEMKVCKHLRSLYGVQQANL